MEKLFKINPISMTKKIVLLLFIFFLLFATPFVVSAQKSEDWEPPEKNGVYDVPGKLNLKVKVFVHEPKDTPFTPALACVDDNSSAVVRPAGWSLPNNWEWYLNTNSAPAEIKNNLQKITSNSMITWQNELKGKVNFEYKGLTPINKKAYDSKNIVAWGKTSGSALGVTYTWYYSDKLAIETDTIMNLKFPWGWSTDTCENSYYDAQNILTHELGHWVGLNDEYTNAYKNNTMFGYGSKGETKKDSLTTGDVAGVNSIYK
mgnify:CR=1 FL=1